MNTTAPKFATLDNAHNIAYTEYGDPSGEPVLFFHGTPGSRLLAALFDTEATNAGVRLLAVDRPGSGHSEPWPDRSIRDAGTVATGVLDDAGVETTDLLAFSGGSQPAISTAVTHSDRVRNVDIVSGSTPPSVSDETPGTQRLLATLATRTPLLLRSLFRGQAWLAERRDPAFVVSLYRTADSEPPLTDDEAALIKADFIEAVANSRRGAVTELRNAATEWGIDFETLTVSVTLWHGHRDTNVPIADVRRFERTVPNGTLTASEQADHLGMLLESVPQILETAGQ